MNHSARRITTIYLVMFALIFNAITSSSVNASSTNGVLLCTTQGYKWVNVESDDNSKQQTLQHCKICLFPSSDDHFDDLVADSGKILLPSNNSHQTSKTLPRVFRARFAYSIRQIRAPPVNSL